MARTYTTEQRERALGLYREPIRSYAVADCASASRSSSL